MTAKGNIPTQTLEVVQFCKRLPLSISIAGKLVADLGIGLESDDDWEGIVELLREESFLDLQKCTFRSIEGLR